jgi:hypothetical protein
MNFRRLFDDLRRFARTSSVIELGSAFALATVGVTTISTFIRSLVITPINESGQSFSGQLGTVNIGHRVFDYETPLFQLLIVALVVIAVGLVVRWNHEDIFGDETFLECPHCLAEIPAAASVCSWCTRDVARPAQL